MVAAGKWRDRKKLVGGGSSKDINMDTITIEYMAKKSDEICARHPDQLLLTHAKPIHLTQSDSLFSQPSSERDYRGFVHLIILLLFVNMSRLVLENWRKYGLLLSIPAKNIPVSDWVHASVLLSVYGVHIFISLIIELFSVSNVSNSLVGLVACVNVCTITIYSAVYVWRHVRHPGISSTLLALSLILAMKLISYHLVNWEIRTVGQSNCIPKIDGTHKNIDILGQSRITCKSCKFNRTEPSYCGMNGVEKGFELDHSNKFENNDKALSDTPHQDANIKSILPQKSFEAYSELAYPNNITFMNLMYFCVAPTLCYQPSFVRNERVRKSVFLAYIARFCLCIGLIHLVFDQYAAPTVKNAIQPLQEIDLMGLLERVLKLSTSSLIIWLLAFYAIFHCLLNAFAEALRFGDRTFYRAWWNARSISEYWRLWNAPVHNWFYRHVHRPLVKNRHCSPLVSQSIIFLLSAVAHEYLIAVPTKIFEGYALLAMLLQIPLIILTRQVKNRGGASSTAGNVFFWICFCILGQPTCVLLYYRAWSIHSGSSI